jgi:alkylation response protein AidB-like acyl-CoA dehydrogenase
MNTTAGLAAGDPRFSVTGSEFPLSGAQRELIARAEQLGRECLAPRAARYDREASFPHENYADLRKAGFLGLCIPKAQGGLGADLPTYALVSATLGKYCGSTALTFNMHACTSLWTGLLSDDLEMSTEQRATHLKYQNLHFGRMLSGAIYAQPFSEGCCSGWQSSVWNTGPKG